MIYQCSWTHIFMDIHCVSLCTIMSYVLCDMSDDGDCVDGGRGSRKTKEDGGGARRVEVEEDKVANCADLSSVRFSAFLPLLFVLEASEISVQNNKGSNGFTQIAFRALFLNPFFSPPVLHPLSYQTAWGSPAK